VFFQEKKPSGGAWAGGAAKESLAEKKGRTVGWRGIFGRVGVFSMVFCAVFPSLGGRPHFIQGEKVFGGGPGAGGLLKRLGGKIFLTPFSGKPVVGPFLGNRLGQKKKKKKKLGGAGIPPGLRGKRGGHPGRPGGDFVNFPAYSFFFQTLFSFWKKQFLNKI